MIPILQDGPALEPVSLAEAKAWLRLSGDAEDDLVRALVVAARLMVEAEIGQVLIGQTWRLTGDRWPVGDAIPVRVGRIIAVSAARIYDENGVATALPVQDFTIDNTRVPPVILTVNRTQPGRARAGIEIDLRLGYGEAAADVPETIRLAIRRLVALWFEHRGDGEGTDVGIPASIRALIRPFRPVRL